MLTLHVFLSFFGLLAGAVVLIALCRGRRQPTWDVLLLASTLFISVTGLLLPSPPGTPTPDPARVLSVIEVGLVTGAVSAIYSRRLAGVWRGIYVVTMVLVVYFNVFVAVVQAFLKIDFLHALAPTGKEPPFAIAQGVALVLFVAIGIIAFRRFRGPTVSPVSLKIAT